MRCPRQTSSGIKTREGNSFGDSAPSSQRSRLFVHQLLERCWLTTPLSPARIFNGFDGMEIVNTGSLSKLMFFNVSEGDYGNYTCVAINKLGSSNTSFLLFGEYVWTGVAEGGIQGFTIRHQTAVLKVPCLIFSPKHAHRARYGSRWFISVKSLQLQNYLAFYFKQLKKQNRGKCTCCMHSKNPNDSRKPISLHSSGETWRFWYL